MHANSPRRFGPSPSIDEMAALAERELAKLPSRFRDLVGDLTFRVDDFCDQEVLRDLGLESPFDLLGLYQGTSIGEKDGFSVPTGPNMIFLYRRPLLDYWTEGEDTLESIIRHVLIHEIGHHFGLSDEDMEAIEET